MVPTKPALRVAMLARLRGLGPEERRERSARLVAALIARPEWHRARVVGLFAPLRTEPDLDLLWTLPGALTGKTVAYPRVEKAPAALSLRVVQHPDELIVTGPGALREPHADTPTLSAWPDLLLVPGLAFTAAGGRLGRGGGAYDRLLARRPAGVAERGRTWGVAFDFQLLTDLPREPHDADLDGLVTDSPRGF